MRYEIVPATLCHLRELVANLREGDLREVLSSGMKPRHLAVKLWKRSEVRRTGIVDGQVAACFGCAGQLGSPIGDAWLLTSPVIERAPLAFAREIRYFLAEMLERWPTIISAVAIDYERAVRFMKMAGFEMGEPFELGGVAFYMMKIERP